MPDKSALGTRIKFYEKQARFNLHPNLPYVARLDGRSFSKWTKDLKKPFDDRLTELMRETTKYLVEQCNGEAVLGYTQSDEISLVFREGKYENQWWGGRTDKIISNLVGLAVYYFNTNNDIPEKQGKLALFDCRLFQLPNRQEAINSVIWREQDAVKNSISMLAQAHFSHGKPNSQLFGLDGSQMQDKLMLEKGINWNDLDPMYKRGSYVQKKVVKRKLTTEELNDLPPMHNARKNPEMEFERTTYAFIDMPIITKVTNREAVFFENADPATL
jgi:tRNA(His) guanylyltransferase